MRTLTRRRRAVEMLLIAYQLDEMLESLKAARDDLAAIGCGTSLMLLAGEGRGIKAASDELTERARFMTQGASR